MRGSHSIELARLKKKKKEEKHLRVPGLVPLRYFFAPVGVLLVMKTLQDECYVVIKAYISLPVLIFENILYCNILHVRAIPTLESTYTVITLSSHV